MNIEREKDVAALCQLGREQMSLIGRAMSLLTVKKAIDRFTAGPNGRDPLEWMKAYSKLLGNVIGALDRKMKAEQKIAESRQNNS